MPNPTGRGHGREEWGTEEILEAIRKHHLRSGAAPRSSDWDRASTDHPGTSTVRIRFGSWNNALVKAGVPAIPLRREWSRSEVLLALRADARKNGRAPTSRDWHLASEEHPCGRTVTRMFGAFDVAVKEAGLDSPPRRVQAPIKVSEDEITSAIRRETAVLGRAPMTTEWSGNGGERPSYGSILRTFGSWRAALLASGVDERELTSSGPGQGWTRPKIIAAIVTQTTLSETPPGKNNWSRGSSGEHPNEATVRAVFGSWAQGLEAAGLGENDPGEATSRKFSLTEAFDPSMAAYKRSDSFA